MKEWSIRDKKVYYIMAIEDGRKSHIDPRMYNPEEHKIIFTFYPENVVEKLREKLIEDIKEEFEVILDKDYVFDMLKENIIKRINRRFGKDDKSEIK